MIGHDVDGELLALARAMADADHEVKRTTSEWASAEIAQHVEHLATGALGNAGSGIEDPADGGLGDVGAEGNFGELGTHGQSRVRRT